MSTIREVLLWMLAFCGGYLIVVTLLYLVQLPFAASERERRRRTERTFNWSSSQRPGVSIVIAAYNEAQTIVPTVRSCLAQLYPAFEVIIVNDGSKDDMLDVLKREFRLGRCAWRPPSDALPTESVRAVYRSKLDPRLVVVDKANGGKADALNCGANVARQQVVFGVDADTVLTPDSLGRGMEAFADPEVVGLTSYVSITRAPERAGFLRGTKLVDRSLFIAFQHLDYVRAFYNSRLCWSRLNYMLCTNGAFQAWRRDLMIGLGGFSGAFTCEDIEFTFRVHEHYRRLDQPYRVVCMPDEVGATEGPQHVKSLVSQRARWQRVILETFWHYRHMLGRRRYGTVGFLGMPFYLISEVIAPVFEQMAVVMLPLAVIADDLSGRSAMLFAASIAVSNGVLTTAALAIADRNERSYRKRDLCRLAMLAPLEFVFYRPILVYARIKGTWGYLRGNKGWDKFERNTSARLATATATA